MRQCVKVYFRQSLRFLGTESGANVHSLRLMGKGERGPYATKNPILKHFLTNDGTRHIMKE